jgi:aminoglycoside/choline kinase family phosphotransferase
MAYSQHLVIPDRSGTHVLLLKDGSGWRLPSVTDSDWMLVGRAQSWVRDRLGLAIVVLRCVLVEEHDTGEVSGDAYLFTENLNDQKPLDGSWLDQEATDALMDERERRAIRQWFTERREGTPRALQPWEYSGWFATAADWIETTLPETASVDQYTTWSVSSLHRVETAVGRYYFKAAPTMFRYEAVVTEMLAQHFPDTIPRPIAIDGERGWMLTADFGDELVATMEAPYWVGSLDALASLQRKSVASVESLLASGCHDRRPRMLQSQVEELASEGSQWLPNALAQRLRAGLSRFQDLCEEVASAPIPNTLVHGDFHADNIAISGGRYLIFDWTDACIAHPFVDVATFLRYSERTSTDRATRERWRDHYLRGWEELASYDVTSRLFERVGPLAAMHQAITYLWLLDSLDPSERWQFGSALEDWVTRALAGPVLSD